MTRLEYDEVDRGIREALHQGMKEYEKTAHERIMEVKHDKAVATAQHTKDLKKFCKMHK